MAHDHQKTLASAKLVDRETLYRRATTQLPIAGGAVIVLIGDRPESGGFEAFLTRLVATHPVAWLTWAERSTVAPRLAAAREAFAARTGLPFEFVEEAEGTQAAVLAAAGQVLQRPLPGSGGLNSHCLSLPRRGREILLFRRARRV